MVCPGVDQRAAPVAVSRDIGKPIPVLRGRLGADAFDVLHRAFAELALVEEPVDDLVMDEGRTALVHYLRLGLRIEILGDDADDPQYLALPRLEDEAVLF